VLLLKRRISGTALIQKSNGTALSSTRTGALSQTPNTGGYKKKKKSEVKGYGERERNACSEEVLSSNGPEPEEMSAMRLSGGSLQGGLVGENLKTKRNASDRDLPSEIMRGAG